MEMSRYSLKKATVRQLLFAWVLLLMASWPFCVYAAAWTINFLPNGGSGSMAAVSADDAGTVLLPACGFERSGYLFVNWNTESDGTGDSYADEAAVRADAHLQLYAQWAVGTDTYTIHYDRNGADEGEIADQIMSYQGGTSLAAGGYIRDGYRLVSWNTNQDGTGITYGLGYRTEGALLGAEKKSITLYAQWVSASAASKTITVTADWEDQGDEDDLRPSRWYVRLTGSDGSSYEKSSAYDSMTFTDIPAVDQNGNGITYEIEAVKPSGYSINISQSALNTAGTARIIFTHDSETRRIDVYGSFEDDEDHEDDRPDEITLKLKGSNGKTYSKTIDIDGDDEYEYQFVSLPASDSDGDGSITYRLSVSGSGLSRYDTDIDKDSDSFTVTHTYEEDTISVTVRTEWNDNANENGHRPDQFQVVLSGNGTKSAYLTKDQNYGYTFEDLPAYKNGQRITYRLSAADTSYYEVSVSGSASSGFVVTQKLTANGLIDRISGTEKETHAETGSAQKEETKSQNMEKQASALAYVRVIWKGNASPIDLDLTLAGADGSTFETTIPKEEEKKWHSVTVHADTSYQISVSEPDGFKSEITSTNGAFAYFTVTLTPEEQAETAPESTGAETESAESAEESGNRTQTSSSRDNGTIYISGMNEEAPDSLTGNSSGKEAGSASGSAGQRGHTYSEDGKEVVVQESDLSGNSLVAKERGNSVKLIAGLTAFAVLVFLGVVAAGKKLGKF